MNIITSPPDQKTIGVAIAGLGFGEKVHLPALYKNKNLNPVALWHPREARLKTACDKYHLKGHQNWSNIINDPQIDAIIIATPPEIRYELAIEALSAGKHLLLEKPVAITSDEIISIQKLALRNRLSVAVDFEYRAVPIFMQLKNMLDKNIIGTPWLIKLDWLMSSRADESRAWNWYSESTKGGGVIGALGTHAFDLLHWLFGETRSVTGKTVTAIRNRPFHSENQLKEVTSEDICLAQLEMSGISSDLHLPAQVTLSSVSRNGRGCWLEIYGSQGSLILGSDNQKDYVHGFSLWLAEKGKKIVSIKAEKELLFDKTWEDGRIAPVARVQSWWSNSIIHRTPMIPGLTEGLLSQKVCERIKESSSSKMTLSL